MSQELCYYSTDSDFKICLQAQKVSGTFEKQAPVHFGLKLKLAHLAFNLLGDGPPKQRIQEKSKLLIQITTEAISTQPCHLTIPTQPMVPPPHPSVMYPVPMIPLHAGYSPWFIPPLGYSAINYGLVNGALYSQR